MFEQKLRFQYSGRFGSQIEPNPKINRAKDAHGYCASFSSLIKKSTYIIKKRVGRENCSHFWEYSGQQSENPIM